MTGSKARLMRPMRQIQSLIIRIASAPGTTPLPKAYPGPGALGADTSGAMRLDASAKPDLTRVPVTGGEEEEAIQPGQSKLPSRLLLSAITCCPKPSNLIQIR